MVEERPERSKIIGIDIDLCTGCRSCEVACSMRHDGNCGTEYSRVKIQAWGEISVYVPVVCQHCEDPPCEIACPTKARKRVEETGAMVTDADLCVGCRSCIYACPFGAPSLHPVRKRIITCDLCDGDPDCAKVWTAEAIRYIEPGKNALKKKRLYASQYARRFAPAKEKKESGRVGAGIDVRKL